MEITARNIIMFENEFFDGNYGYQRYGQAACNTFVLLNKEVEVLFYETDMEKCRNYLWSLVENF